MDIMIIVGIIGGVFWLLITIPISIYFIKKINKKTKEKAQKIEKLIDLQIKKLEKEKDKNGK